MRLEDLLQEYRASLPAAPAGGFEELLASAQGRERRRRIVLPIFAALAACLLLAFAIRWRLAPPAAPLEAQVRQLPPPAPQVPALPFTAATKPSGRRPIRPAQLKPPPIPLEDWSGFVPVAQSRLLPQSNYLQLLRVSVSADRLAAIGVPTFSAANAPGDNNIAAELLLGEDGLIRAVRVLR